MGLDVSSALLVGIECQIKKGVLIEKVTRYDEITGKPKIVNLTKEIWSLFHNDIELKRSETKDDLVCDIYDELDMYDFNWDDYDNEDFNRILVGKNLSDTGSHRNDEQGYKSYDLSLYIMQNDFITLLAKVTSDSHKALLKVFPAIKDKSVQMKVFHYLDIC